MDDSVCGVHTRCEEADIGGQLFVSSPEPSLRHLKNLFVSQYLHFLLCIVSAFFSAD